MTLFGKAPRESPKGEQVPYGAGKLPTGQGQQSFRPRPITPQSGPTPHKFKPSPWYAPLFQSSKVQKPITQKPLPAKTAPVKPKTLFEEKKDWTRSDFLRKATKDSFGSGGKMRSSREREKILKEALPVGRFGTYISEGEAKTKLRELRSKEYYAKGAEKAKLKETRKNLEKGSGLAGKY